MRALTLFRCLTSTCLLLLLPLLLPAQFEPAQVYLSTQQHLSRELIHHDLFATDDQLLNVGKDPRRKFSPFTLSTLPNVGVFASKRLLVRTDFALLLYSKQPIRRALLEMKPMLRYYLTPARTGLKFFLEGGGAYTVGNNIDDLETYTAEASLGFTHLMDGKVMIDGILTYRRSDFLGDTPRDNMVFSTRIGFLMTSGSSYGSDPVTEIYRGRWMLGMSHFRAGLYDTENSRGSNVSFRPQLQYVLGKHLAVGGEISFAYFRRYENELEVFSNNETYAFQYRKNSIGIGPSVRAFFNKDHRSLFFAEAAGRVERRQIFFHYISPTATNFIYPVNQVEQRYFVRIKFGLQHFLNPHAAFEVAPALHYDFVEQQYRFRLEFGFQVVVGQN